jgi:hypothetical protein
VAAVAWVLLLAVWPAAGPAPIGAQSQRGIRGIHTLARESRTEIDTHLTWAALLVGPGGYVTQPFAAIDRGTPGPSAEAVYFVEQAYARDLIPIIRMQGAFRNQTGCEPSPERGWLRPEPDDPMAWPPTYAAEAEGYLRFVAGLPRVEGRTLYVQVGNEPNLHYMWSGTASPVEYARFSVDVASAIRSLGDERVALLNAALAPEGDVDNLDFLNAALAAEPSFATAFDYWAAHAYPHNQPPERNLHDGTALPGSRYTIDSYLLELEVLRRFGPDTSQLEVIITESGYALGDRWYPQYPEIGEQNRADYMQRAFEQFWSRWPEVRAVTPFQLTDPHGSWQPLDWIWPSSISDAHGFPTQSHLQYARLLGGVGVVHGTVVGSTGNLLKDVSVSTGPEGHRAVSLADGSFTLIAFPGTYGLTAAKIGHRPAVVRDIRVEADGTVELRLTLPEQLPATLQDPSFELEQLGSWTAWGAVDGPQIGPWYFEIGAAHGASFLGTAVNCGEKDGGVYQSVTVRPGRWLTLRAQGMTFRVGDEPPGVRVGIDPDGGVDPRSGRVVWSEWVDTAGGWRQIEVSARARGERATMFLEHDQQLANAWNVTAFDAVELVQSDEPAAP